MANGICSIDGCEKSTVARGWCANHWRRWREHGDPLGGRPGQAVTKAIDHADGTRTCSQCLARQPIESFDKVSNATMGRRSDCKACRSTRMRERYAARRAEFVAQEQERRDARLAAKIAANPEYYARLEAERAWNAEARERVDSTQYRRQRRIAGRRRDPGVNRKNLRLQYGDNCYYCDAVMDFTPRRRGDTFVRNLATVEHVVPIALGGTHTWDNTVLACWACNGSKQRTPLAVWLERRDRVA